MDRFTAMRIFVKVAETGSFSKAAVALGITRPTATRMVQSLESLLGYQLIHRTTRTSQLTPQGARYFEGSVRILADLAEIEPHGALSRVNRGDRLKIEVDSSIANGLVIPHLAELLSLNPDIGLDLHSRSSSSTFLSVSVDCSIRFGEAVHDGLTSHAISSLECVTCVAPSYLERHGTPHHPSDLASGHRSAGLLSARTGHALPPVFMQGESRFEPRIMQALTVSSMDAYVAAGLAGLGIIQAPRFIVQDHLETEVLIPLLQDWQPEPQTVNVLVRPSQPRDQRLAAFVDWVLKLLRAPVFAA